MESIQMSSPMMVRTNHADKETMAEVISYLVKQVVYKELKLISFPGGLELKVNVLGSVSVMEIKSNIIEHVARANLDPDVLHFPACIC